MQEHERFEELSALAVIGELTADEHQELRTHWRSCSACRRAANEFALVIDQLPFAGSPLPGDDFESLQTKSYRERFLKRASEQGINFSKEASRVDKRRQLPSFSMPRFGYGFAVACLALTTIGLFVFHTISLNRRSMPPQNTLGVHADPTSNTAAGPSIQQAPAASDETQVAFARKYGQAEKQITDLRRELAKMSALRESLVNENERQKEALSQLQARSRQTDRSLATVVADMEKLRSERDNHVASLVAQEVRIRDLIDELNGQKAAVEQERQLTAVAKDVRELMGARNLHIIDVFDADGRGRAKKSFGRVFYTEGKSLIFYAFDLEQKGSAGKVSFQAWGQREGFKNQTKNLGVFFIDDQSQKRWVLKVNDPEKLKNIDSLFVTVERFGGVQKPTGQTLLYAYLGSQANHP
jgi:hypothetical protein